MELGYVETLQQNLGGFSYDNCLRNTALMAQSKMDAKIKTMKTGTTICGIIFKVTITHFLLVNLFIGWSSIGC